MNRSPTREATLPTRTSLVALAAGLVAVSLLVALLLDHPPGGVFGRIEALAAWFRGGEKPEVVTWPAWGYAALLAVLPSHTAICALQVAVSTVALTALAHRLGQAWPARRWAIAILLLLALPWHVQQVELYPSALAGSLTLLALLALDRALTGHASKYALAAAFFAGLAQNFRTEFLLVPVVLASASLALRGLGVLAFPSWRPLAIYVGGALLLQLPWAFFHRAETGRLSLTESNLGHVLYVSLGSDPRNPWGLAGDDQSAADPIRRAGQSFSSLSAAGNRLLLDHVGELVRAHPGALVSRTRQQLRNTLVAPFGWGVPRLSQDGQLHLDVLREELKSRLNVGVNTRELQDYRDRNLLPRARADLAAVGALVFQTATVALGATVLLLGLTGIVLFAWRPALRPREPLLVLLAVVALYKVTQNVLLCYQVNYLNNAFPLFLPFVIVTIGVAGNWIRSRRAARGRDR